MYKIVIIILLSFFQVGAQTWQQEQKIVHSFRNITDLFGTALSIDGNYLIVASHFHDFDENDQNNLSQAGAVYIFEKDVNDNWIEINKLAASDRAADDQFGWSVDISGDYAIVGARLEDHDSAGTNFLTASGSAYIFERDSNGDWLQVQKLTAAVRGLNDQFGQAVSISGDYAVVGALADDEDENNANFINVAGSAYIFKRDGVGVWNQVQKIVASDRSVSDVFGHSVSMYQDYLIVGTPTLDDRPGAAYVFEKDINDIWIEVKKLTVSDGANGDQFGFRVDIDNNYAIVGALTEEEDESGQNTITESGSAYIFERNGNGDWNEIQKLVASDRDEDSFWFGYGVSISDKYALIGARYEDKNELGLNPLVDAGATYIYERMMNGTWTEIQKIVALDRVFGVNLGYSTGISGDFFAVGAISQSLDSSGENPVSNAGAAYMFKLMQPLSIDNDDFGSLLKVYPNPTLGELTIDLGINYNSIEVTIINSIGQQLFAKTYNATQLINFEIKGAKGIYFVEIIAADGKKAALKVLKQ